MKQQFCLVIVLTVLSYGKMVAQEKPNEPIGRDRSNWITPFQFITPTSWNRDSFALPAPFTPSLSVTGWEDVRFPQDWREPSSDNHWSYAFLWWLPGSQQFDTKRLEQDLNTYFDGLIGLNVKRRNIPADSVVATAASLTLIEKPGTVRSFKGTIRMLNYHRRLPMDLTVRISSFYCEDSGHTAVLFLFSPQPEAHPIWEQLSSIESSFRCKR